MIEEIVPVTREELPTTDVDKIVARLEALQEGESIKVRLTLPEGVSKNNFRQKVYVAAMRAGFHSKTQFIGGWLYITKSSEVKEHFVARQRVDEILRLAADGKKYKEIASIYGVTRQRIEQVIMKATRAPIADRTALQLQLAQPYIDALNETPLCLACSSPVYRKQSKFCKECSDYIRVVRRIGSRLRWYKRSGQRIGLANALHEIREQKVPVEAMRFA